MSSITIDPILAPIELAAHLIGRGRSFIYEAIGDGRIKAVKSDKRTLVVVKSLKDFAASLPEAKTKPSSRKRRRMSPIQMSAA